MKFTKKPEVVEAFTFEEFIEYGKKHAESLNNDMPWSFDFKGISATHENDECYLLSTAKDLISFTPGHILTFDRLNGMTVYSKEDFKELFEENFTKFKR